MFHLISKLYWIDHTKAISTTIVMHHREIQIGNLTKQEVREFQLIHYQETHKALTMEEAREEGMSLIRFLVTIFNNDIKSGGKCFWED